MRKLISGMMMVRIRMGRIVPPCIPIGLYFGVTRK
jgi:hypothetical protein